MSEKLSDLSDEICMAFLKKRQDLALKEGDENRVYNAIALDKSDIAIAAIDFAISVIMLKSK